MADPIVVAIPDYAKHSHTWDAMRAMPTVRGDVHESVYRAYHVLDYVQRMISRGDSLDTIDEFLRWVHG
jgi:hypothetical protein